MHDGVDFIRTMKTQQQKGEFQRRLTVSLDPQTVKLVERIARKSGVSASWVIRYAVAHFLKEYRKGAHPDILPASGGMPGAS